MDTGAWPQCQTTALSSPASRSTRSTRNTASPDSRCSRTRVGGAVDVGLAGARRARLAHHRNRSADRASVLRERLRPAADGEAVVAAGRPQPLQRAGEAQGPVDLAGVQIAEVGQLRLRSGPNRRHVRFGQCAGGVEQRPELQLVHLHAGAPDELAGVVPARVEPFRVGADARDAHGGEGFLKRRGGADRAVPRHHPATARENLGKRIAGTFGFGVEVREPPAQAAQRVARQVQSAQRVEAQAAADARLRRRPDRDGQVGRAGESGDEARVGEGDLEHEDQIRRGSQDVGHRRVGGVGLKQQMPRPAQLAARGVQCGEHGRQPLPGEGNVERGSGNRQSSKLHSEPSIHHGWCGGPGRPPGCATLPAGMPRFRACLVLPGHRPAGRICSVIRSGTCDPPATARPRLDRDRRARRLVRRILAPRPRWRSAWRRPLPRPRRGGA